jgi:hypothetical protein
VTLAREPLGSAYQERLEFGAVGDTELETARGLELPARLAIPPQALTHASVAQRPIDQDHRRSGTDSIEAFIRLAYMRSRSGLMALSWVATMYQLGIVFQPGVENWWLKIAAAIGLVRLSHHIDNWQLPSDWICPSVSMAGDPHPKRDVEEDETHWFAQSVRDRAD